MAIAFRSSAVIASGSRTNTTIGAPAGAVNGSDVIVVAMGAGNSAAVTVSPPGGWTQISTAQYSAADPWFVNMYLFSRVHDGSANWTFTHSAATTDGAALAYSGVDNTTPSDTTPATNTGTSSGNATINSITIATAGALRIAYRGSWDGDPTTPTAGWTERIDQPISYIMEIAAAATGATGTDVVDAGNALVSPYGTIHAALRPDTAPVGPFAMLRPAVVAP